MTKTDPTYEEEEFIKASEAARMCGVSSRTVRRWIKAGLFPGARRGLGKSSPYLIPRREVEAFVARRLKELGEEKVYQHLLSRE